MTVYVGAVIAMGGDSIVYQPGEARYLVLESDQFTYLESYPIKVCSKCHYKNYQFIQETEFNFENHSIIICFFYHGENGKLISSNVSPIKIDLLLQIEAFKKWWLDNPNFV